MRRLVARPYLRLGRKKEERTKQRRGAATGLAQLFVANHGPQTTTDAGARSIFLGRICDPSRARRPVLRGRAAATLRPSLPPLPAHHATRRLSGRLAIRQRNAAVDDDIRYARRELLGFLERRVILDRRGIEHDDVGEVAGLQLSTILERKIPRGQ